jgi:hypothetical protein
MSQTSVKKITVSHDQFSEASTAAGLAEEQAAHLWLELEKRSPRQGAEMFGYIVAGIFLLIGAIATGMWLADYASYTTTCLTSLVLMAGFGMGATYFGRQESMRVPSGLLWVLTACMTPVVTTSAAGIFFGHATSSDSIMFVSSLATVIVGAALTLRSRISFVALPALIAGAAAVTTLPTLFHESWSWSATSWLLVGYGLVINQASIRLDGKTEEDYSFWGYVVGIISFWAGIAMIDKGELGFMMVAVIGLASIATSVYLSRAIFAVAGVAAVAGYVIHLLDRVFHGSLVFDLSLVGLGIALLVAFGKYRRNADAINTWLRNRLPTRG